MGSERSQVQQKNNHKPAAAEKNAPRAKTSARASFYSPSQSLAAFSAASPGDIPLTHGNLLFLQRTVGNRAVVQLLQRNEQASQPCDACQEKADQGAEKVVREREVQRQTKEPEKNEEETPVQAKPV